MGTCRVCIVVCKHVKERIVIRIFVLSTMQRYGNAMGAKKRRLPSIQQSSISKLSIDNQLVVFR